MPKKTMFPTNSWLTGSILGGLASLALGCTGTSSGEVDSDTTQTSSTIGMSSTSPPTGTNPTTGETTGEPTGTSTDGSSSSSSSTGLDAPPLAESCASFCEFSQGCIPNPYPDLESCLWSCTRHDDQPTECVDSLSLNFACLSELTCSEYGDALMGNSTSCDSSAALIGENCDLCPFTTLTETNNCSMVQACAGESEMAYVCEGEICTCLVDGEPQAECPKKDLCDQDFGTRAASANACCGFDF